MGFSNLNILISCEVVVNFDTPLHISIVGDFDCKGLVLVAGGKLPSSLDNEASVGISSDFRVYLIDTLVVVDLAQHNSALHTELGEMDSIVGAVVVSSAHNSDLAISSQSDEFNVVVLVSAESPGPLDLTSTVKTVDHHVVVGREVAFMGEDDIAVREDDEVGVVGVVVKPERAHEGSGASERKGLRGNNSNQKCKSKEEDHPSELSILLLLFNLEVP